MVETMARPEPRTSGARLAIKSPRIEPSAEPPDHLGLAAVYALIGYDRLVSGANKLLLGPSLARGMSQLVQRELASHSNGWFARLAAQGVMPHAAPVPPPSGLANRRSPPATSSSPSSGRAPVARVRAPGRADRALSAAGERRPGTVIRHARRRWLAAAEPSQRLRPRLQPRPLTGACRESAVGGSVRERARPPPDARRRSGAVPIRVSERGVWINSGAPKRGRRAAAGTPATEAAT